MSPNQWGPPIWTLFHCLAEKIKEDKFREIGPQLFSFIKKICLYLPCPDCSMHATSFLSKVKFEYINNKTDFKHLFYAFHNIVNRRKRKSLFNVTNLSNYSKMNLINAFNNFVGAYHTKGNMKLIADSFQRNLAVKEFKQWFMNNYKNFDK
jgi:hypothetical protein